MVGIFVCEIIEIKENRFSVEINVRQSHIEHLQSVAVSLDRAVKLGTK